MVKIPPNIVSLCSDPQVSKVLATIEPGGKLHVSVKGRFMVVDEEYLAFADLVKITNLAKFQENQKATIRIFKAPSHGYQINGTFIKYISSGPVFDEWSELLKKHTKQLAKVGLIKVDEIFSYESDDLEKYGTKI